MEDKVLTTPAVENQTGRLDKFLVGCFPDYSRNQFIHLIEAGAVQVLGHPERILKADSKILKGDIYTIIPPEPVEADPEPEDIPLDIYYEDDDIMVVNKKSGMVVHPGNGNHTGTLVNALINYTENLSDSKMLLLIETSLKMKFRITLNRVIKIQNIRKILMIY